MTRAFSVAFPIPLALAACVALGITACVAELGDDADGVADNGDFVSQAVECTTKPGDVSACVAELADDADEVADKGDFVPQTVGCTTKSGDGSFVCLSDDGQWLIICDMHADGHYAYARTYRYGFIQDPIYDENGAAFPCRFYPSDLGSLTRYNICVQYEGCGDPVERFW